MTWGRNSLYQHVNNTTVAIEVKTAFYVTEKASWSLRVTWWNVGAKHTPWSMNIEQRVWIREADRANWKRKDMP